METLDDFLPLSPDHNRERLTALKRLFPDLFTNEGRLNVDELKKVVDPALVSESERYDFRWYGKSASKRDAFSPSRAALVRDPTRSINPDRAGGNMIIEGENLEVLKLLSSAYRERIKCIYIDPPYNTGKDFVYSDRFAEGQKPYWEQIGVLQEGLKTDTNTESEGRFHSKWLSMMHSRLLVARYLLQPDGVILISIDDHEYQNLKRLMDEVFGPENFIANIVWEKGRKNDARYFSVGHEYLLVFAKDFQTLKDKQTVWRQPMPGATEIWEQYLSLKEKHGGNFKKIETDLSAWFSSLPSKHPAKKLARYRRVDKNGPWRDRDISWPGGDGPRYDVIHPKTGKPCKVPADGWRFSKPEEMQRQIDLGLVEFRNDETEPPFRKAHIKPIPEELASDDDEADEISDEEEDMATQVRGSYFYAQSQVAVKYLKNLMGGKLFSNPKDHHEIAKLIDYVTNGGPDDIVLDFFAGSGTTAEALIDLNRRKGTNKQFILVQLPEFTEEKDAAYKAGYKRISDLTIERVRRVIERNQHDAGNLLPTDPQRQFADRLGFHVFRLAKSVFPRVEFAPAPEKSEAENIELLREYIREKEATFYLQFDREKVLDEVLLKNGFLLDYTLTRQPEFAANEVYLARDAADKEALLCLDSTLKPETVDHFKTHSDQFFICLELALDTTKKWNLQHHLGDKLKAI